MGSNIATRIRLCDIPFSALTFFVFGFAPQVFAIQQELPDDAVSCSWAMAGTLPALTAHESVDDPVGAPDDDNTGVGMPLNIKIGWN